MTDLQEHVPLAHWCTLDVGGPARWFVRATSERAIVEALDWAAAHKVAVLVLGGGSNVVIADEGFPGLVLQIAITGIDAKEEGSTTFFDVGSGEPWDAFVARTVDAGCAGLECLSGIPGLVGGTPVQNVGAYGQEVSSTIRSVRVIDIASRRQITIDPQECGFGYRTSRFKHDDAGRFIVTAVEYGLAQNGAPTIAYADVLTYFADRGESHASLNEVRAAIIEIRSRKGMVIREDCDQRFINYIFLADDYFTDFISRIRHYLFEPVQALYHLCSLFPYAVQRIVSGRQISLPRGFFIFSIHNRFHLFLFLSRNIF